MTTQQIQPHRGIVKQVLSGDSVILRATNNPAAERQINFSGVTAPKLGRRLGAGAGDQNETKDEPWAWEAREFLRKKLIEKEVSFISQIPPNTNREYGTLFFGKDFSSAENITHSLISEGLVTVKKEGVKQTEDLQRLIELENAAKQAGKGKWGNDNPNDHVRDVKWAIETEQMGSFVKKHGYKPIKAIIEHVRDGSTVRAFLLPEFYHVTVMITGIRCPGFKLDSSGKPDPNIKVPFAEEARAYVELRLLQHDVEVILESVNNNNFIGTIIHPRGNIAESLLREGLAYCVDWSMNFLKNGSEKLRAAEQLAKEKRLRYWKDWQSNQSKITGKEKDYQATVVEIINGDAVMVKLPNGDVKKVFLSSIRPPKEGSRTEEDKNAPKSKTFRPLYDIPYMFEAREYLRRELIGKKVHVVVDYIQEARDNYPEKTCATVTVGGKNVAEGLVAKGLASVVKYRADDDQRSSKHHDLLDAEMKAIKSQVGMHSKKKAGPLRVTEIDASRAKLEYSALQRAQKIEAIVEFVTSGSRLRLYIPKSNSLCTFLLGGINCPRAARPAMGNQPAIEGEPFGEEAFKYTKEHCLQREVSIQVTNISTTGKTASLIGWLWVDNMNLSIALVNLGYSMVHRTGEKSQYAVQLKEAEDNARKHHLGIWKDYVEEKEEVKIDDEKVSEEIDATYEEVIVTEVTPEGHFFVQNIAEGPKAEALYAKFRQEFQANPPLPGSFTPKRGEICAAKYKLDDEWYRAKVEKVQGGNAQVFYIDYGNRETVPLTRLASLPANYASDKPFATEYCLPFVILPKDEDYANMAFKYLQEDTNVPKIYLSVVYRNQQGPPAASLHSEPNTQSDIIKNLVAEGLLMIENTKSRRNHKVLVSYKEAQEKAKKSHLKIWEYGDITEDDTKEFGLGN